MKPFSPFIFYIITLLFFIGNSEYIFVFSQQKQSITNSQFYKFRIYLKDKGFNEYTLEDPSQFLSPKSIDRKKTQNVEIDERDFPISKLVSLSEAKKVDANASPAPRVETTGVGNTGQ